MDAQLNSPLIDPRERRAGLSERFATLLLRMAEKDPALRPGDWALLRAELGALRDPERPGANGLRAVRRGLARLDVRLSLAFLVLAAVAFGLTLAFRGGEAPDDGHRRAIAEAKARGALDEIDLRLEAYPGTELEAYESLRGLVERYPGTAAGHEALVRIRAIRGRLEALRKTRYTSTAQRARKLEAEGEYDRGIALLVELRPTLEATEWGPEIESEIRRIEGVAAAMLREVKAEIETLVDAGRLARALERLEDAPYQKAGGLAEYIDLERDRLRLELDR